MATEQGTTHTTPVFEKNDPRIINGWAIFDWANSAYALVITVAIFPPYFLGIAPDTINIGGFAIRDETLIAWGISLAYLIIAAISPILSGIADYGGKKKRFMRFFTVLGSLACISLFFFDSPESLWIGLGGFVLATVGFAGGIVFYNAYLPDIATEDRYDAVSARGFIYGFAGSVILLVINLAMVLQYDALGFPSETSAIRWAFVSVGLWWLGFAQISFKRLPPDARKPMAEGLLRKGYDEVIKAFRAVRSSGNTSLFLLSFFCYNAGVQAILFLASSFADKEMHMEKSKLIILVLILQLVAILGAFLSSRLSEKKGNRTSLFVMLIIWSVICLLGYSVHTESEVFLLGGAIGLVMGGIQALSRSTYAKFLPENTKETTSFFSFYDVMDKVSTVFGTMVFGLIAQLFGGMRSSVLALSVLFLISLAILIFVRVRRMPDVPEN
ncbi:MAG: MFS transporter [Lewinellaceae bacterium]|nr:MFS transporter [Saprospiraceae bacterium]MCB9314603.1 MFS transporter [Lewinellaceae bacterium]